MLLENIENENELLSYQDLIAFPANNQLQTIQLQPVFLNLQQKQKSFYSSFLMAFLHHPLHSPVLLPLPLPLPLHPSFILFLFPCQSCKSIQKWVP